MRTPLRGLDNHELQLCYTCPAGVFLVGRPHPFEFLCLGSRSVHRYVVRLQLKGSTSFFNQVMRKRLGNAHVCTTYVV